MLRRIFGPKKDEIIYSGENYILRGSSISIYITKYFSVDEMNKNELGELFSPHMGREKCIYFTDGVIEGNNLWEVGAYMRE